MMSRALFSLFVAMPLLFSATIARAQLVPFAPGGTNREKPLTIEQMQSLDHAQLREELLRRGVPQHLVEQTAGILQRQMEGVLAGGKDSRGKQTPNKLPPRMGEIDATDEPIIQVTPNSSVHVLGRLATSRLVVRIRGKNQNERLKFAINNITSLGDGNSSIGPNAAMLLKAQGVYDSKPQPFQIYGVTRNDLMFSVMLPEGMSGSGMPGDKAYNVAAFVIDRDEFPVTLYLTNGHDIAHSPIGYGPGREPEKLFDWLKKNTPRGLTLKVTAEGVQTEGNVGSSVRYVMYNKKKRGFVFVDPSKEGPDKTVGNIW